MAGRQPVFMGFLGAHLFLHNKEYYIYVSVNNSLNNKFILVYCNGPSKVNDPKIQV